MTVSVREQHMSMSVTEQHTTVTEQHMTTQENSRQLSVRQHVRDYVCERQYYR